MGLALCMDNYFTAANVVPLDGCPRDGDCGFTGQRSTDAAPIDHDGSKSQIHSQEESGTVSAALFVHHALSLFQRHPSLELVLQPHDGVIADNRKSDNASPDFHPVIFYSELSTYNDFCGRLWYKSPALDCQVLTSDLTSDSPATECPRHSEVPTLRPASTHQMPHTDNRSICFLVEPRLSPCYFDGLASIEIIDCSGRTLFFWKPF